jgi:hypothetical protein
MYYQKVIYTLSLQQGPIASKAALVTVHTGTVTTKLRETNHKAATALPASIVVRKVTDPEKKNVQL